MTVIKRILLTVFLAVTGLSLSAQEKPDSTAYRFRFVAENDMFFSPWSGNGQELERLLAAIDEHRPAIEAGQMYLLVTSYATDGNEEQTAAQVAKTRRNRVKSELIVRGKIKESNFVTDQLFDEAYTDGNGKSLHNMVIVTLPASVEKVAEIAGAEAAARVEAYNKEVSGEAERERMAAKEQAKAEQTAKEKAEQERIAAEQAAREKAEAERMERERMAAEQVEKERLEAEEQARLQAEETAIATPYHFALRANLLRWATLTPDLGIEWRINRWTYGIDAETMQAASDLNDSLHELDGTVLFIPYGIRQRNSQLIETYVDRDFYIAEYETLVQTGLLDDGVLDLTTEAPAPEYPGHAYTDLAEADWLLVSDDVPLDTTNLTPSGIACPAGYTLWQNHAPTQVQF